MLAVLASLAFAGPPYHACDTAEDGAVWFVDPATRGVFRYTDAVQKVGELSADPKAHGWPHILHVGDDGAVYAGWHDGSTQQLVDGVGRKAKWPDKALRTAVFAADVGPDGLVEGAIDGAVTRGGEELARIREVRGVSVASDGTVLVLGYAGRDEVLVVIEPGREPTEVALPAHRREHVGVTRGPKGTFLVASSQEGSCLMRLDGETWSAVGGECAGEP